MIYQPEPEFLSFYHHALFPWTQSPTRLSAVHPRPLLPISRYTVLDWCRLCVNVLIISHDYWDTSSQSVDGHKLIASRASASISFILSSSSLSIPFAFALRPSQTKHKYPCQVRGRSTSLVSSVSHPTGSNKHHSQHHLSVPTSSLKRRLPTV